METKRSRRKRQEWTGHDAAIVQVLDVLRRRALQAQARGDAPQAFALRAAAREVCKLQ